MFRSNSFLRLFEYGRFSSKIFEVFKNFASKINKIYLREKKIERNFLPVKVFENFLSENFNSTKLRHFYLHRYFSSQFVSSFIGENFKSNFLAYLMISKTKLNEDLIEKMILGSPSLQGFSICDKYTNMDKVLENFDQEKISKSKIVRLSIR